MSFKAKNLRVNNNTRRNTYKAVAFGTASDFVRDDDCLQDITVLDEMIMHCFFVCVPSQSSYEHFGQLRVSKTSCHVVARRHWIVCVFERESETQEKAIERGGE